MPFSELLSIAIKDLIVSNTAIPALGSANRYVALHSADPGVNCTIAELSGDGYTRTLTTFDFVNSAEGKAIRNNIIVLFPVATATKGTPITHFSIWTDSVAGNSIGYGELSVPANWTDGINLALAVNALVLTAIDEL